jgi:hypothetical protein
MAVTPIAVSPSLASVLNAAGDRNDVDFDYLLKTAIRESALDPTAKTASSSATGLFQFLDSTWLQVMKSEGPRLGYQKYADAITRDRHGDYVIKDPRLRAEVLKLREDPQVAADMAAAFTKSNGDYLKAKFGRMPSPGELYIAHFLGPQGAEKMFDAGLENPDQIAAKLFPREASANRTIFYDHGQPRTIRQVYKALVAQHEGPDSLHPGYAVQQLASAGSVSAPTPMDATRRPSQPVPLAPLPVSADPGPPLDVSGAPAAPAPAMASPTRIASAPATAPRAARSGYYVIERPVVSSVPEDTGNSRPVTSDANTAPDIPSRIGPENMSFATLFSTEPDGTATSPVAPTMEDGGAFFSQLYGQQ